MKAAGLDGCRTGWILVSSEDGKLTGASLIERLTQLPCNTYEAVWIDIPIGLPSAGSYPRPTEKLARKRLPGRGSTVFPVPVEDILAADSYPEANALHKQLTGSGLQKQSWFLLPKIAEARETADALSLTEAHPELLFASLNGGPVLSKKKQPDGREDRIRLLETLDPDVRSFVADVLQQYPRSAFAADDLLDACVLSLCASHPGLNREPLDPDPRFDSGGRQMNMMIVHFRS
ncbi:DUF429 domain-containing protein [Alkalicoccus luteus]|uniref:DUF429 domain-containing protein n=1 Tax=Alkalicoccus luteus TaxID=1237094 RepID=A0A969PVH1_9BACI|nr:DUF429 domain-containing protein [Alkalicoccus luteus]